MPLNISPYYFFISMSCVAIIFVSSCTYVIKDIETNEYKTHPLPSDQVKIVKNEELVTHCHAIASIRAKGGLTPEQMINKLQKEAGKLGANVLLVIEPKPKKLTPEDVVGEAVGTVVVGALTGEAVSPAQELKYVDGKAFYCN